MRREIVVMEKGETLVDLTFAQAIELQGLRVCRVLPTATAGQWRVTDVSRVGVVALTDVAIVIKPKTPVRSIIHMASLGAMQLSIDEGEVSHGADSPLPSALADALVHSIDVVTRRGLLKGYQSVQESASVVRGRWDIARQLAVRPGIPLPIEIDYDDFTEDISENRILYSALRRLRDVPDLTTATRRRLNDLLIRFSEVTGLPRGMRLPDIITTRLNAHYSPALQIARVVLDAVAWTHSDGHLRGGTFLVNMALVFERYVAHILQVELADAGYGVEAQDQQWRLDTGKHVVLRPDIVISRAGPPVTVADTKYKVFADAAGSPPNGDVYQALAYALALGVKDAHLLYVSGDATPRRFDIPSVGVRVHAHAVDLDGPASEVDASVRALAVRLVGGGLSF
ncbi:MULTISPECIES: McrC family protein [Bacteria]